MSCAMRARPSSSNRESLQLHLQRLQIFVVIARAGLELGPARIALVVLGASEIVGTQDQVLEHARVAEQGGESGWIAADSGTATSGSC